MKNLTGGGDKCIVISRIFHTELTSASTIERTGINFGITIIEHNAEVSYEIAA